nr:hypothetical protein [Tanacetum cinerariifolium]
MLLGVYWYYGFPEGLYHFDFFAYRPGIGGSSGGPAELTATVQAPDPAALLAEVRAVATRYPDGYLDVYAQGPLVRLMLGDWALTDYTFHLAGRGRPAIALHRYGRAQNGRAGEPGRPRGPAQAPRR